MASLVRSVLRSIKEKGVGNFARELRDEGYLNCIFDGNLLQTKLHNIGATIVGVDKFGNKYYEKLGDTQYAAVGCFHYDLEDIDGWNMRQRIATMLPRSHQNGMVGYIL